MTKNIVLASLISLFAALIPAGAHANTNIYQCEVLSDAFIKSNGSLELMSESMRVRQKFTVFKKTGEIVGDVMDSLKNPRIVSRGLNRQPYKVIWEQKSATKSGVYVDYLSIDETAGQADKPFGFFSGSLVLSGVCR